MVASSTWLHLLGFQIHIVKQNLEVEKGKNCTISYY